MGLSPGIARSLAIYYGRPLRLARLVRFYRSLAPPGGLYFDIGAHVGHRVWAARRAGLKVVAVEPHPECLAILRRFFGRDRGVTIIDAAIAAKPGEATLRFDRRNPTVSSTNSDWMDAIGRTRGFRRVRWKQSVTVPAVTLTGLIERHGMPDYCKIDIEGSELEALRGLDRPIDLLSLERLPGTDGLFADCLDRLCGLAPYRFNWTRGEKPAFAGSWTDRPGIETMLGNEKRVCDVFARSRQATGN